MTGRMATVSACLVFAASACVATIPKDPGHSEPLSAQEHLVEAERHEAVARAHDSESSTQEHTQTEPECYDRRLRGMICSGGEPIRVTRPCWTRHSTPSVYHRAISLEHLRAAAEHRTEAAAMLRAEREACADLGEEEISHSPFYHREDIAAVKPYYQSGAVRGARVIFRKLPGLTADWMRKATRCHLARARVMGYSMTYMRYCPLMLEQVEAQVRDTDDGIVVTMWAHKDEVAAAILGRAMDLLKARPDDAADL